MDEVLRQDVRKVIAAITRLDDPDGYTVTVEEEQAINRLNEWCYGSEG